jgi:hypothetical protein
MWSNYKVKVVYDEEDEDAVIIIKKQSSGDAHCYINKFNLVKYSLTKKKIEKAPQKI